MSVSGDHGHMYKISGEWINGDIDCSKDSHDMCKYYVIKVDENLKPIGKTIQSDIN